MKLTGNKSQCGACGEVFSSVGTFDRHRIGKHGARRCMISCEMLKGGMRLVGGVWKGEEMPASARVWQHRNDFLDIPATPVAV